MSNDGSNWIENTGDKDVVTQMFKHVKSEDVIGESACTQFDRGGKSKMAVYIKFVLKKAHPYPEKHAKMDAKKKGSSYRAERKTGPLRIGNQTQLQMH